MVNPNVEPELLLESSFKCLERTNLYSQKKRLLVFSCEGAAQQVQLCLPPQLCPRAYTDYSWTGLFLKL